MPLFHGPSVDTNQYILAYGGDPTTGRFLECWGASNDGTTASRLVRNEMRIPIAGTVTLISWRTVSADSTTDLLIWLNGSPEPTTDLTGAAGSVALSITVAAGDLVAIEFEAGTAPGDGLYVLVIDI